MSDERARARLLSRINHELRAPLARIAALAAGAVVGDARASLRAIEGLAHRQLEWLADLQQCARCELQAPELALAPAYLHGLLRHAEHAGQQLPAVATMDAAMLTQVLLLMQQLSPLPAASPLPMAQRAGKGVLVQSTGVADAERRLTLGFSTGDGAGPWHAVEGSLTDDKPLPALLLAMHLVRAMGGALQQSASGLRFEISVALAEEADVMPPAPRFMLPPPFGEGKTVLVLEPHGPMREYVADILESAAFNVVFALNGRRPALVLCANEDVWQVLAGANAHADAGTDALSGASASAAAGAPPVLLHAMLPPERPQDFAAVLYKPASPEVLLKAVRCALSPAPVRR